MQLSIRDMGRDDLSALEGVLDQTGLFPADLLRSIAEPWLSGQADHHWLTALDRLSMAIIRRSDTRCFVVLPRRWVVERTIAWLNRCRRLAKEWKASIASSEAWIIVASIRRMMRRIAKLKFRVGLLGLAIRHRTDRLHAISTNDSARRLKGLCRKPRFDVKPQRFLKCRSE